MGPKKDNQQKPKFTQAELDAMKAADAVVDVESDEHKFEIRKEIRKLKEQSLQEDQLISLYSQEREKINYNWIISKKELEDTKSELINKDRDKQDLNENHIMTLNIYKQKIKHLLFVNQDQQSELKKDVEVTLKQFEDEHRIKSRELKTDNRNLKVMKKEQELSHYDYLFALNSEFDKQQTLLRQEYERIANDIKKKYDQKMNEMRKEMEELRQNFIKQLEEKKDKKISTITKEHEKKYNAIKNYYSDITATNLDLIKTLKNEINQHTQIEERDKKMLAQIERESKELQDPLQQLTLEKKQLDKEYIEQEQVKGDKELLKKTIENLKKKLDKLEYDYEVKLQEFKFLDKERNLLFDKFHQTVYEIHQKTGLDNLILEKKVSNIQEELEIKDLQLHQTLKSANIDSQAMGAISQSLEEVESMKNQLISDLQGQLKQIRKAHSHMVKAYEGKLSEFVIPVEELGFDPLVPTNIE